eukprot:632315-Rhodomonas_salina.1
MPRVARAVESTTEGRTKPAIAKPGRCIMPMETVFTSVWLDMLYRKAQSASARFDGGAHAVQMAFPSCHIPESQEG